MEGKKKEKNKQGILTKKKKNTNTKAYHGLITVLCPQAT